MLRFLTSQKCYKGFKRPNHFSDCTSNEGGNIHLAGSPDLGMDLPDPNDDNYPDGAKIGLVFSED